VHAVLGKNQYKKEGMRRGSLALIGAGCFLAFYFFGVLERRPLEEVQGCTFERRSGSDGQAKAVGSLFRAEDGAEWAQVYEGPCARFFLRDGRSWRQCYASWRELLAHLRWFCVRTASAELA
jgi:hypothetical protein